METARAVYSNTADTVEELSFTQGEILRVLEVDVGGLAGWWLCSLKGRTGIAPGNRLQLISPGGAICPSLARKSSERSGTPDTCGGGRSTPNICGGGRRTPDICGKEQRSCRGHSAVSPLARQSLEREGLSRSGSFRQHGSNLHQKCDQSATYDAPQHLLAHQDLQDYDVPSARYQGENTSCNHSEAQGLSPRPITNGRIESGDSTCNYDSPATLRHEYDTLRDIREMSRALNEIQSGGLMGDSLQNYDSPSTLKRGASLASNEQNYDSPQSLLASQEQNYDSPQTLLASNQQTYQSPQSLRNSQTSPSGSQYSLQSCRGQHQSCSSPRQSSNDMYDSPMNLFRNSPRESINDVYDSPMNVRNSSYPMNRSADPQVYDSPHTLTRGGSRSLAHSFERSSDSPSTARPARVNDMDDHAFTSPSGQFRVQCASNKEYLSGVHNQCASPKEHCSGVRQQQHCHMGEYDVPSNVIRGETGARCSGGVISALSNRSSVLSSVGSRSSACSGSSPSGSARSSTEVYELSPSLNPLESSAQGTVRGCNVEAGNVRPGSGELSQAGKSGRVYQQQQQFTQQSCNIYDNRDSYLDDYSVPRSDSSVDSGISVQSGANDQQVHDSASNDMKADQQVAGEYDIPSQLVYPASPSLTAISHNVNSVGFPTSPGNSGSYNIPANHRKPPAVKPKPKSKPPERFTPQGRPLPAPPSYATVVPEVMQSSRLRLAQMQDDSTRLGGSGEGSGSKADISVIVSDSASEWNDDCDYVTIANDAELEVKRKVEEARSGNHFNARLASEAFNSRVNRPTDGNINQTSMQTNDSSRLQGVASCKDNGAEKFTFQVPHADKPITSNGNAKFQVQNSNNCSNSTGGLSDKFKERLDAVKKATNMTGDAPSGRVSANIEPVIEFYASQADVILSEVEAAAGDFFNCEGIGSIDAGSFARRGRNVILAAHKLVYVSDAMARLGTLSCEEPGSTGVEGEGVGEIVQAANTLCESLKSAVVATRNAALLYPDATSRQRAEDCILSAVAECAELCDVIHANATHLLVG